LASWLESSRLSAIRKTQLFRTRRTTVAEKTWLNADEHTIWEITGQKELGWAFHECLAIVLPQAVTGAEEPIFAMLPPLDYFVTADQIAHAVEFELVRKEDGNV
jgi:hypothetical protein